MGSILDDVGEEIKSSKNKDIYLKWILVLLPYIIGGTFFIGGAWVTFKIKFNKIEKYQIDNIDDINDIKKNVKNVDEKVDKLNARIDNTNQRIDNIFIQNINEHN